MTIEEFLVIAGSAATLLALRWAAWLSLCHGWRISRDVLDRLSRATRGWRRRIDAISPVICRILTNRLRGDRFSGLALTLIAIAAFYMAVLFAGLVDEVLESEELLAIDTAIADRLDGLRSDALSHLFTWITQLADTATLTAVTVVATVLLWAHGSRRFIAPVWVTLIGSHLTTWTGKFIIDRPRPEFLFDVTAYTPAFPSGHATGAMAIYGIFAYVASRELPSHRHRFEIAYWSAVLISLIAFSRIYLNVHHASDVAAGLLVGAFWLLAGIAVCELSVRGRAQDAGERNAP